MLAYEPQKDTFSLLEANIRRNRMQDQIQAFPYAIGASNGSINLSVSANLAGGMSTTSSLFRRNSGITVIDEYEVPMLSLSEVLAKHANCDIRMVKLDCEGSELDILRALQPSDWSRIEGLACELHPEAYAPAALFRCLNGAPIEYQ